MNRMGRPPKEDSKKISINIRVTEEQRQELKERAIKNGKSLSEYVLEQCFNKEG